MINILIDCANKEVSVDRDNIKYYLAKTNDNIASATVIAWQIVHELSHKFDERIIQYFGITPDGREMSSKVDIGTQAFCLLMDNFGSHEHLLLTQTSLGVQLLVHNACSKADAKESEKK